MYFRCDNSPCLVRSTSTQHTSWNWYVFVVVSHCLRHMTTICRAYVCTYVCTYACMHIGHVRIVNTAGKFQSVGPIAFRAFERRTALCLCAYVRIEFGSITTQLDNSSWKSPTNYSDLTSPTYECTHVYVCTYVSRRQHRKTKYVFYQQPVAAL
jgi:hypothetical protein